MTKVLMIFIFLKIPNIWRSLGGIKRGSMGEAAWLLSFIAGWDGVVEVLKTNNNVKPQSNLFVVKVVTINLLNISK